MWWSDSTLSGIQFIFGRLQNSIEKGKQTRKEKLSQFRLLLTHDVQAHHTYYYILYIVIIIYSYNNKIIKFYIARFVIVLAILCTI